MKKRRVWKKDEFREFIATLKERKVEHWVDIAKICGVSESTISYWKQLPEVQDAIQLGIINTIESMETAGKKDWRMWEAKLKMLGVNPANKVEGKVEITDSRKEILAKYGLGGNGAGETKEAEGGSSSNST